jgi:ketosteroid isomerase-like protein
VTNFDQRANPLEVVSAFGETWANHDLDSAMELITEDCVFENTDPAPDGTTYVGRVAIRDAWAPIFADPTSRFEAEETFWVEDRVIQRWRYSWANGHVRGVDVIRVRDGLVAEKLSYVKG